MVVKTFLHKNERWGFAYYKNKISIKWALYHKDDIIRRNKKVYYDDKLISEEIIYETKEVFNHRYHKMFHTINEMKVYVEKNF